MTHDEFPLEEVNRDGMAWDDFLAGTLAGVALTLTGHPFDTVKVRLQTQPELYRSGLHCLKDTIQKEGFFAIYKGMGGPMLTVPLVNAIVFAAYGQAKDTMLKLQPADQPLTLSQISAAGAYAGLMNSFIVGPVELVKTRLQLQHEHMSLLSSMHIRGRGGPTVPHDPSAVFNGPFDCVQKILKQNGVKGLFRGMSATIYREIPGYASQFFAYEALKRALTRPGEKVEDLGAGPLIMAGGIAGIFGWCWSYPMDFIKSQIQSEPYDKPARAKKHPFLFDGGFIDAWRTTVRQHGHRALWRGFGTCAARAFPANAAGFLAYEWALDMLRKNNANNK